MKTLKLIFLIIGLFSELMIPCTQTSSNDTKIKGITLVAPPKPFQADPMPEIKAVNSEWVAIIPYAFIKENEATVRFGSAYWWGEGSEGTRESIRLAKEAGLKVMLKPHIWIRGSWIGDLEYDNEKDWKEFEETYKKYIMTYLDFAIENEVEMFCIGTEVEKSAENREDYWRAIISEARSKYSGQITYSSNWDNFKNIPFWDALDHVGISAYFPLSEMSTPSVSFLKYKWNATKSKLYKFHKKYDKPILFTEYGYLSVDGCADKTWILEKQRDQLNVNEKAQANALEALYDTFWDEPWWSGGFYWKWYPLQLQNRGSKVKDYTPQGKIAEKVIREWYGSNRSKPSID